MYEPVPTSLPYRYRASDCSTAAKIFSKCRHKHHFCIPRREVYRIVMVLQPTIRANEPSIVALEPKAEPPNCRPL